MPFLPNQPFLTYHVSRAPYRWGYVLKTSQGCEQQVLQVTLLGLPQGHTEGIKSLGAPLGQQVEEFHILAETAHLGLRYKNKT